MKPTVKNKSEKTALKREDSRTYLNGVNTTRGGKLAKYGGLVRPQNDSRVDQELDPNVSRKLLQKHAHAIYRDF